MEVVATVYSTLESSCWDRNLKCLSRSISPLRCGVTSALGQNCGVKLNCDENVKQGEQIFTGPEILRMSQTTLVPKLRRRCSLPRIPQGTFYLSLKTRLKLKWDPIGQVSVRPQSWDQEACQAHLCRHAILVA